MANRPHDKLTAERLHKLLRYDSQTGIFTRRFVGGRWSQYPIGSIIGRPHIGGYISMFIDGEDHQAHRVAWIMMTGEWPKERVDHRDRNRANNRWTNLRLAIGAQHLANSGLRRDNRLGFKGMYERRYPSGKSHYCAKVQLDAKQYWCGSFNTPEEAHAAYVAKAKELFGEFHCPG